MQPTFKMNALSMVFGNAIYAGCQWLVILVISNFGSTYEVGLYAMALAVVGPIFILTNMGLRQAITTDVKEKWKFSSYFRLRLQSMLIGIFLVGIYILLFDDKDKLNLVIMLLAGTKLVDSILDLYYGYFQRNHRLDIVSLSRSLTGVLGALLFSATYYFGGGLELSIVALILGWALSGVLVGHKQMNNIHLHKRNTDKLKLLSTDDKGFDAKLFWLVFPLGWTALLISLRTNIPRYFVESEIGTVELGVFAATGYLIHLLGIVVAAVGRTACPKMAEYAQAGQKRKFINTLGMLLATGLILGLAGIGSSQFWGREIVLFFYGAEMAKYSEIFNYLMIIALISYLCGFLNYAMEALRIFKRHFAISLLSTIICLIACFIFIGDYGIFGVCMAWFISLLSQAILSLYFIIRRLNSGEIYQ